MPINGCEMHAAENIDQVMETLEFRELRARFGSFNPEWSGTRFQSGFALFTPRMSQITNQTNLGLFVRYRFQSRRGSWQRR